VTPAIVAIKKAGICFQTHEYQHSPNATSYGLEAVEKLGISPERVYKTLVVTDDHSLFIAIIPVQLKLSLKAMANAVGAKKITMAHEQKVIATTGYVLGGISPLGQKKRLLTIIDQSAQHIETMYVSGGKRGLEIEIKPSDLVSLTTGKFDLICAQA